jgi:hypothetical protein
MRKGYSCGQFLRPPSRQTANALILWCGLTAGASTLAQTTCVPYSRLEFGPYDYRVAPADKLRQVELFHFTSNVEALTKGQSTVNIGRDLEFTLRYFPNHVRALNAMIRLGKRDKTDRPSGSTDTIDCWLQRARTFRPDDGTVRLLYAIWLVHRGQKSAAEAELAVARQSTAKGTANFEYNMGLAYLELGDFAHALQAAHTAYAMGYSLPGLRDRLKRSGKWREPSPPIPASEPAIPPPKTDPHPVNQGLGAGPDRP